MRLIKLKKGFLCWFKKKTKKKKEEESWILNWNHVPFSQLFPPSLTSTLASFYLWSRRWTRPVSDPRPVPRNSRHCEMSVTQGSSGRAGQARKDTVHDLRRAAPNATQRLPRRTATVPTAAPQHLPPSHTLRTSFEAETINHLCNVVWGKRVRVNWLFRAAEEASRSGSERCLFHVWHTLVHQRREAGPFHVGRLGIWGAMTKGERVF